MMTNISQSPKVINNGDRICQAELVETLQHDLTEIKEPPTQKTQRDGGFGSTGS
jgi:dUTPase